MIVYSTACMLAVLCCLSAFCPVVHGQTVVCNKATNYGGSYGKIYNLACPPERPYCTGSGLCSECAVGKDSLCDCPPNYKCVAARFNTVRNADFCVPTPLSALNGACSGVSSCPILMQSQQSGLNETAFYAVCTTAGTCRYCNGPSYSSTFLCTQGEVPGGGDPRVYGSKTGARACLNVANAWNSATAVLNPPLPTDPFEYERNEYPPPSSTPTASMTATPSLTLGAAVSRTPHPVTDDNEGLLGPSGMPAKNTPRFQRLNALRVATSGDTGLVCCGTLTSNALTPCPSSGTPCSSRKTQLLPRYYQSHPHRMPQDATRRQTISE